MRQGVLGPGNWHQYLKEEQEFQAEQKERREARIAQVAMSNSDDPDFTFDTLCERFSWSYPDMIKRVLRERCWTEVSANGRTLVPIPTKLRIVR